MKKLIVGNWKMNGTRDQAVSLAAAIATALKDKPQILDHAACVVCPPFVHLEAIGTGHKNLALGAQDCSSQDNGAYTGDVSAAMLKDIGCEYVILGHSERRQYHKETDELVAQKAVKAHAQNLITIICVGETESERGTGLETEVVARQLEKSIPSCADDKNTVIAYEPVWAIGTGKTAGVDDVKTMHGFIRKKLQGYLGMAKVPILYGGSVKPDNAGALLATENVDGGLIGGASLDAAQFMAIAQAAKA